MGRRGKRVTAQKKTKVLELLENYTPSTVSHMTNLSVSEVYKIRRESRQKAGAMPAPIAKMIQDVREFIPESMPAEQFLARYGDKLDPETRKVLEVTKPRLRLHTSPPSEETVIGFEMMTPEEAKKYDAQRLQRLEAIEKLAKELPNPWTIRRARQKESKEG